MTDRHHDDLHADAAAWVLGALPDDEAERYRAHLADCSECAIEVAALQSVVDVLPLAAPAAEPSPDLRARIMDVVEGEAELLAAAGPQADRPPAPRREGWWTRLLARPWIATAGATALLAVGVLAGVLISGGGDMLERPVTGTGIASSASGMLMQKGEMAELRVSGLPAPPSGHVYQVWIMRGHKPQPDAVFTVDRHGRGSVGLRGDVSGAEEVLVTDEPAGGSATPTTQPFLSATPA